MPWDCADVVHVRTACVKLYNVGSGVMARCRHSRFSVCWQGRIRLVTSRVPVGIIGVGDMHIELSYRGRVFAPVCLQSTAEII